MTRRIPTLLLLLLTGLCVCGFATLLRPTPGVTLDNFDHLGRCTTLADVDRLMGCESTESGPSVATIYTDKGRVTHYHVWYGDGIRIVVGFNQDDVVCSALAWRRDDTLLQCGLREPKTVLDTIRVLLRL
jgi:hypothetical protein